MIIMCEILLLMCTSTVRWNLRISGEFGKEHMTIMIMNPALRKEAQMKLKIKTLVLKSLWTMQIKKAKGQSKGAKAKGQRQRGKDKGAKEKRQTLRQKCKEAKAKRQRQGRDRFRVQGKGLAG
jgi:hypothetical protein